MALSISHAVREGQEYRVTDEGYTITVDEIYVDSDGNTQIATSRHPPSSPTPKPKDVFVERVFNGDYELESGGSED